MTEVGSTREKKRGFAPLLRGLFYVGIAVILFFTTLVALVYVYEDEIKAGVISELNKSLRSEVQVQPTDIDITILRTFPDCALQFRNVLMLEAIDKARRDTLVFAGRIRLHFDFLDIWKGNYELHKVSLEDAILKASVAKNGQPNYNFWKSAEKSGAAPAAFRLNQVRLKNVLVVYSNKEQKLETRFRVENLKLKGDFAADRYELDGSTDLFVQSMVLAQSEYLSEKKLSCAMQLNVNTGKYVIRSAKLNLNGLRLVLSGGFEYHEKKFNNLELKYDAPEFEVGTFLSLVPERYRARFNGYEGDGGFFIGGKIVYTDGKMHGRSDFGARKARVSYVPGNTSAENLDFSGIVVHGDNFELEIRGLKAELGGGSVAGNLRIKGLDDPHLWLELSSRSSLEDLHAFFPVDTLQELSGLLRADLQISGLLSDLKQKKINSAVTLKMQIELEDLVARFKHDEQSYRVASCGLKADKGRMEIKDLHLKRGSSDLTINGQVPGLLNYLTGEEVPLVISGSLQSENLVVDDFLPETASGNGGNSNALIPPKLVLSAGSSIKSLSFGKFRATDVSGQIEIRDQKIMLSDLKLETMQGEAVIDAFADNSMGRLDVTVESSLNKINITELFKQMNNFGQITLSDKHIKGFASANINFSGSWSNTLESDPGSVKADCDLTIERGELIDFKPLLSLGRFVDVNDLRHVRFSQLSSRIGIAGQKITVSRTSVKNSVLVLDFYGSHTFDHEIDYHFQMLTADLLAAKKKKVRTSEFGEIATDQDNQRSVFIVMSGNLDDPRVSYDREGLKRKIKNDVRKEKENIKMILKEEFALFKKSETRKTPEKTPEFKLEPTANVPVKKKELVLKKKEEEDF